MEIVAHGYLGYGEARHSVDKLVNMTYIFQKLAAVRDQREWVTTSGAHKVREQVKLYEGVPVLLSLLHSDHLKLLWSVVWILVQICEDPETSVEIRIWGGIKQLLHILLGLFPTDLFETFIDIGHYVRDISAYEELVSKLNLLVEDELKQIAENVESINQNKAPSKYIGNYAILDHLGSGAFGCVYKVTWPSNNVSDVPKQVACLPAHPHTRELERLLVRKRSGQNLLAMKEVNLHNPAFGKDKKDRDSSIRNIVSELTIIKEQVMVLLTKLCLALRYLHKEKRIIHRDLTPNNIMLGDKDRVTV
ncbi:hypothetical protein Celaphus_00010189, partial [Cervus elaphus hippelaphus]